MNTTIHTDNFEILDKRDTHMFKDLEVGTFFMFHGALHFKTADAKNVVDMSTFGCHTMCDTAIVTPVYCNISIADTPITVYSSIDNDEAINDMWRKATCEDLKEMLGDKFYE